MTGRQWPESEKAWKQLAADILEAQQAEKRAFWAAQMAQDAADFPEEPLSPEEEETLF